MNATSPSPVRTRVRELRLRRGLKQSELASLAGLTIGTVSRSEYMAPSLGTLSKLARALGVAIDDLVVPPDLE